MALDQKSCEALDPRIRRTRHLLQQSLCKLMKEKDFDSLSVQDIAEAASVNRATFYDHYSDKFALLECMVAGKFHELLADRRVQFNGSCPTALKALVLAVYDYLAQWQTIDSKRQFQPHTESAILTVLRDVLLEGLKQGHAAISVSPEMIAATVSWAIYGAVKEWIQIKDRCAAEDVADTIVTLISPILGLQENYPQHSH